MLYQTHIQLPCLRSVMMLIDARLCNGHEAGCVYRQADCDEGVLHQHYPHAGLVLLCDMHCVAFQLLYNMSTLTQGRSKF